MKKITIIFMTLCLLFTLSTSAVLFCQEDMKISALFIEKTGIYQDNAQSDYKVYFSFNKSIAAKKSDITAMSGEEVVLNGFSVSELTEKYEGVRLYADVIERVDANKYICVIEVPLDSRILASSDTNTLLVKQGFTAGMSNAKTTVLLNYKLGVVNGSGSRVYRLADDNYQGVALSSIGAPSKLEKQNMTIKLYMDKTIANRKLVNMQFWTSKMYYGLALPEYPYTDQEIANLFNFGIAGVDNPNSMLYKIEIGSDKYNGLTHKDNGSTITSAEKIEGYDMYALAYLMNSSGGADSGTKQLSVQLHMYGSTIEFILKGDSENDNFNLAPDTNETIIIKIKAGMLFSTGLITKKDAIFMWKDGVWKNITNGNEEDVLYSDTTIKNQGGYTDEEISALNK